MRNPDYRWAPSFVHQGPWYLDAIELRLLPEAAARVAALDSGTVNMVFRYPEASWQRLRADPRFQLLEGSMHSSSFLEINLEDPILSDVRVRQALQHALDREAIVQAVWEGHGQVGYGVVEPSSRGALAALERPPLARPYDPAAARRLLDAAGWRDAAADHVRVKQGQRLALSLIASTDGNEQLLAQIVQAQLRAVGIEVRIESGEAQTGWAKIRSGDYQLAMDGMGSAPDAAITLTVLLQSTQIGNEGMNFSRYRSAEVDELLRRARATTSEREHFETLAAVQRAFSRDAVFATIGYPAMGIAMSRKVRGVRLHPLAPLPILDDAWID